MNQSVSWPAACLALCLGFVTSGHAQSLGNAGTVEGTVVDQSGAAVPGAVVSVHNAISGYNQSTTSAADGSFRLSNIPPNPYHLEAKAANFNTYSQDISIRNAIPIQVKPTLSVAGAQTTVTVEAAAAEALVRSHRPLDGCPGVRAAAAQLVAGQRVNRRHPADERFTPPYALRGGGGADHEVSFNPVTENSELEESIRHSVGVRT